MFEEQLGIAKEYDIPGGQSQVIDLSGASFFVVYAASGTPTKQPCTAAGTALAGTSAASVTVGVRNDRVSHYTKVTAPAAQATKVLVF